MERKILLICKEKLVTKLDISIVILEVLISSVANIPYLFFFFLFIYFSVRCNVSHEEQDPVRVNHFRRPFCLLRRLSLGLGLCSPFFHLDLIFLCSVFLSLDEMR